MGEMLRDKTRRVDLDQTFRIDVRGRDRVMKFFVEAVARSGDDTR
jgi:hypothetical protein